MGFIHYTLAEVMTLRVLPVLDSCSRECLALAADRSFKGGQVDNADNAHVETFHRTLRESVSHCIGSSISRTPGRP